MIDEAVVKKREHWLRMRGTVRESCEKMCIHCLENGEAAKRAERKEELRNTGAQGRDEILWSVKHQVSASEEKSGYWRTLVTVCYLFKMSLLVNK